MRSMSVTRCDSRCVIGPERVVSTVVRLAGAACPLATGGSMVTQHTVAHPVRARRFAWRWLLAAMLLVAFQVVSVILFE